MDNKSNLKKLITFSNEMNATIITKYLGYKKESTQQSMSYYIEQLMLDDIFIKSDDMHNTCTANESIKSILIDDDINIHSHISELFRWLSPERNPNVNHDALFELVGLVYNMMSFRKDISIGDSAHKDDIISEYKRIISYMNNYRESMSSHRITNDIDFRISDISLVIDELYNNPGVKVYRLIDIIVFNWHLLKNCPSPYKIIYMIMDSVVIDDIQPIEKWDIIMGIKNLFK